MVSYSSRLCGFGLAAEGQKSVGPVSPKTLCAKIRHPDFDHTKWGAHPQKVRAPHPAAGCTPKTGSRVYEKGRAKATVEETKPKQERAHRGSNLWNSLARYRSSAWASSLRALAKQTFPIIKRTIGCLPPWSKIHGGQPVGLEPHGGGRHGGPSNWGCLKAPAVSRCAPDDGFCGFLADGQTFTRAAGDDARGGISPTRDDAARSGSPSGAP